MRRDEKFIYENEKGQQIEFSIWSPFFLERIHGIDGLDNLIYTDKSNNQDGSTLVSDSLNSRNIIIEGSISTDNIRNREKILKIMNPKLEGKLIYKSKHMEKYIDCKIEQAPKLDKKENFPPFLISLLCPDPFWKDIEEESKDLVTWIPNLEFPFSTEQGENYWLGTEIEQGVLTIYPDGTIEIETEGTIPETEITYQMKEGSYKTLTQYKSIFSVGTGYDENGNYVDISSIIVYGQVSDVIIKGLTIINKVINGDFSGGTNGWYSSTGSLSVEDKILSVTADGSYKYSYFTPEIGRPYTGKTGDKIFFYTRQRVLDAGCSLMQIYANNGEISFGSKQINNPVQNQWYDNYNIVTLLSEKPFGVWYFFQYPDTATANGKIMEIDGNIGLFVINMTQLGIEYYTEEQMIDLVRQGYFEGTKSTVGDIKLKSSGKNLLYSAFQAENIGVSVEDLSDSSFKVDNNSYQGKKWNLKVISGQTYTFSGKQKDYSHGGIYFVATDAKNNITILSNNSGKTDSYSYTFTIPNNINEITIELRTSSTATNKTFYDLMFRKGTITTEYESYQEETMQVKSLIPLKSLPNGVRDEFREEKLVQNISNEVILNGSEDWVQQPSPTANQNLLRFTLNKSDIAIGYNKVLSDRFTQNTFGTFNNIISECIDSHPTNQQIIIWILDTKLTTTDSNGFKNWLSENPTSVTYQLAEPIITDSPKNYKNSFEEFQLEFGTGEGIEFGYRLLNQIVEIDNIGDVKTPIRIVFRADADVVKPYIQDMNSYKLIRVNKTLKSGDVLEIITEYGNKNIYLNGEKAHQYLDFINSTWLQLNPGINLIKYGAESGINNLECRVFYTPKYLGV